MRKNRFLNLSFNIFRQIVKNKGLIITFCISIVINIILGIQTLLLFKKPSIGLIEFKFNTNVFPLINTLFLTIFIALLTIKLFSEHFDEKLITLERRIGYHNKDIYFSRILVLIVLLATLIISLLLSNLIFYAISYKGVMMKFLFLNSIGWYTIWCLIVSTLVLIGSVILKPVWNMTIIMILTIATGVSLVYLNHLISNQVHEGDPLERERILNTFAKQNIEKEINSDQISQLIYFESIGIYQSFENEEEHAPNDEEWLQKKQFILGPGAWKNGFELDEQFPNYSEMAKYFHEMFGKLPESMMAQGFNNFYDLVFYEDKSKFKKLLNFVVKNNTKYPFINNLLMDHFDNYLFLSTLGIIGRDIYFILDRESSSLIEKNYYSYYEYWFFSSINKIFLSYFEWAEFSYEEYFESDSEKFKKDFNINLFTVPGNLSLMYSGVGYGKEKLYMQISNNLPPVEQILNLKVTEKTLENGTKFYEFKEAVSVIGLYIGYTIICCTVSGLMYFAFRRKITK